MKSLYYKYNLSDKYNIRNNIHVPLNDVLD